jgi:hypothetical protein
VDMAFMQKVISLSKEIKGIIDLQTSLYIIEQGEKNEIQQ